MREQLLAIVVALVAAAAPLARAYVKTKLTPERIAHVVDIARLAVRAAQRMSDDLGEGLHPDDSVGAAKRAFAVSVVTAGARRLGIHLSEDEALAHVHQALAEMEQAYPEAIR